MGYFLQTVFAFQGFYYASLPYDCTEESFMITNEKLSIEAYVKWLKKSFTVWNTQIEWVLRNGHEF